MKSATKVVGNFGKAALIGVLLGCGGGGGSAGHTHEWGAMKTVVDATCVKDGIEERMCNTCGEVETHNVGKNSNIHANGMEYTGGTAPTCELNGIGTETCKDGCGYTKTGTLAPHGHDYHVTTPASCTTAGSKTCSYDVAHTQTIPASTHAWGSWSPLYATPATCETAGGTQTRTRVCAVPANHVEAIDGVKTETRQPEPTKLGHSDEGNTSCPHIQCSGHAGSWFILGDEICPLPHKCKQPYIRTNPLSVNPNDACFSKLMDTLNSVRITAADNCQGKGCTNAATHAEAVVTKYYQTLWDKWQEVNGTSEIPANLPARHDPVTSYDVADGQETRYYDFHNQTKYPFVKSFHPCFHGNHASDYGIPADAAYKAEIVRQNTYEPEHQH